MNRDRCRYFLHFHPESANSSLIVLLCFSFCIRQYLHPSWMRGSLQGRDHVSRDPFPQIPIQPPEVGQVVRRRSNGFDARADGFQTRNVFPSAVSRLVVVMHHEYLLVAREQCLSSRSSLACALPIVPALHS